MKIPPEKMAENYDQHYQMSVDDKFVVVNCPAVTDVVDKLRDWNRARGDVDNFVVDCFELLCFLIVLLICSCFGWFSTFSSDCSFV